MTNNSFKVMSSRKSDEWATSRDYFELVEREFGPFDLDVCATKENTKVESYYTKEQDGLNQIWFAKNWCNPPYSNIKEWIKKASEEQKKGNMTVMLIPSRTDTIAFHEYIYNKPNVEIRFIKGRLKFGDQKYPAPFPSMLVIFRPN